MSKRSFSDEASYEIKVAGHLDESWASWFEGLEIGTGFEPDGSPITILSGSMADQAALHGVLTKIRDLGLQIHGVNRIESASSEDEQ